MSLNKRNQRPTLWMRGVLLIALAGCGSGKSTEEHPLTAAAAAPPSAVPGHQSEHDADTDADAAQTEAPTELLGRWRLNNSAQANVMPKLLEFRKNDELYYLTKPEEETPPYEEIGSYSLEGSGRIEISSDFFKSGSRTFRFVVKGDKLVFDDKFEYLSEHSPAGAALAKGNQVPEVKPMPGKNPPGSDPTPAVEMEPEDRAAKLARSLVGIYELQGANPKVRLPRFLQFEAEGGLSYPAGPDAERPNEMVAGSFEISPDDSSLQLECDWFDGGSRRFSGNGFRPDGKSITADGRFTRFILEGKYEYRRLAPEQFAAARAAKPALPMAGPNAKSVPTQPDVLAALKRLKPGERYALALTGDAAPGATDQAKFVRFGTPVVAKEQLVFRAALDRGENTKRDGNGPEGIVGGEFGSLSTLLRTGTVVPDGPPRGVRPEHKQNQLEEPQAKRRRWIATLLDHEPDSRLLHVDRDGLVIATGVVEEAGRGRQPMILSIPPRIRSVGDRWNVVAIAQDVVPTGAKLTKSLTSIRFPYQLDETIGFVTTDEPLVHVQNDGSSESYRIATLPTLSGLAVGEEIAEISDFHRASGAVVLRARLKGPKITEATDEAIWLGQPLSGRGSWHLILREGTVLPDFVAFSPTIVDPRIVRTESDRVLVTCRLRRDGEQETGGGALISAWFDGAIFVSHVWGTASLDNRDLQVERIFSAPSGELWVLAQGTGPKKFDRLMTVTDFASVDDAAKAKEHPIDKRVADGRQPPPQIQQLMKSTKPRGPNSPPIYWQPALFQVPAEERRLSRGSSGGGILNHLRFVRFLDPKDATSRQAPKLKETDVLASLDDPAPGLPKGTRLTDIRHYDGQILIAEIGAGENKLACWEVEKEVRNTAAGNESSLSPKVLLAAVGQTIEVRPGDRRRIARLDFDPAHGITPARSGNLDLPEMALLTIGFEDGSEGVVAVRTSKGQFIPPTQRPVGTN